jgi:diguanylate cyclase (GGDEF)-like protein
MSNLSGRIFSWSIIAIGCGCVAAAAYFLPFERLDWQFALLVVFALTFGSRLSILIPRSKVRLMMSDAIVFLTLLLYGGEAAILVSTAETFVTSYKLRRQGIFKEKIIVALNPALIAISTSGAYLSIIIYLSLTNKVLDYNSLSQFITLLGLMSLAHFALNSTLASAGVSFIYKGKFWQTWSEQCFAATITSVAGALFAGAIYKLIGYFDFFAVFILGIIIGLVFLTYRLYLSELERTQEQAEVAEKERAEAERRRVEEAEKHIAELSRHIAEQERISEALRQSKERFQHAALHDALTGLPNRTFFFEQVKFLLERNKHNTNNGFCVLFMDLDGFKKINDSLGHACGDKLLVHVARSLERTVRQGDTVARLGGDEFAIVLTEINQVKDAINFAERIKRVISNPFEIDGHKIFTSSSIGIAISNHEYLTPEEILRDADIAMYNAKENHLGCAIFDRELRVRAVNSIRLETDLRQAIDRNELRVYYQPIVSLESGALSGFEALIRWQHPERGLISPAEFIPLAESNGQIVPMSNWILAQACGQLSRWRWRSAANRSLLISVNLSSRHFTQPDLIETVKHTLQETGLDPRCLKLELTESAVMDNAEQATSILQSLRSIGVQLSIDDFGTGYSSLSYLHKFPIDTLKIDRSFVSRMAGDSENSEIVRTIITLAQNLGLDTIAEGVETLEQLNELRSFGCRYAQGYLFAKPVPHEQIDELMRTQTNWLPEGVQPFQSDVPIQAKRGTGRLVTLPTSLKA